MLCAEDDPLPILPLKQRWLNLVFGAPQGEDVRDLSHHPARAKKDMKGQQKG